MLVSLEQGPAVAYALWNLEERGVLFIGPGEKVYAGMIIGEHSRPNDLDVNPLKGKQLTNIRAAGKDDAVLLTPPVRLTLEQALAYIADDELVEVTPRSIRLRKRQLDAERAPQGRQTRRRGVSALRRCRAPSAAQSGRRRSRGRSGPRPCARRARGPGGAGGRAWRKA